MVKFVITHRCNRNCEYCIMKNVPTGQEKFPVEEIWENVPAGSHLMITGGEPTLADRFELKIDRLSRRFKLHITTQNFFFTHSAQIRYFRSITFSLHEIPDVSMVNTDIDIPVYASILADQYTPDLISILRHFGFSGLTINEEQRGTGKKIKDLNIPEFKDFSVKKNYVGHCNDEKIIMPDGRVITDFSEYL